MARLDAFLVKLFEAPGSELVLETGKGAVLSGPAGQRPLIRQPLTTSQIVGAFAEVVPSDLQAGFPSQGLSVFSYLSPSGAVEVRFAARNGDVRATVKRHEGPAPEAGGDGADGELRLGGPRPGARGVGDDPHLDRRLRPFRCDGMVHSRNRSCRPPRAGGGAGGRGPRRPRATSGGPPRRACGARRGAPPGTPRGRARRAPSPWRTLSGDPRGPPGRGRGAGSRAG